MKLLLISGHGAGDPGAVATIGGVAYREADETVKVAQGIRDALAGYDCTVELYDVGRNAYADYKLGVLSTQAHFERYDYVLEIHFNAGVSDAGGNGSTTGVEIFYPSAGKKSGAEYDVLKAIAAYGLKNRGIKSGQFAVINTAAQAGCKANLLEVCFLDDADDMYLYALHRAEICAGIAQAIAAAFDLEEVEPDMTEAEVRKIVKEMLTGADTTVSTALAGELAEAKARGITDGTCPGGYATRAQVAAMIVRATKE